LRYFVEQIGFQWKEEIELWTNDDLRVKRQYFSFQKVSDAFTTFSCGILNRTAQYGGK
jgi:hypothetical protein